MSAKITLILLGLALGLTACANHQPPPESARFAPMPMLSAQPSIIRVTGRGTVRPDSGHTISQMKLLAQRAARMDAYRLITEHVYGLKLSGNTTVADMVVKNDSLKSYVNGFIRGAREISMLPMGNDEFTYESVMEVKVDQAFFDYCYYNANQAHGSNACFSEGSNEGCDAQDRYFYMSR